MITPPSCCKVKTPAISLPCSFRQTVKTLSPVVRFKEISSFSPTSFFSQGLYSTGAAFFTGSTQSSQVLMSCTNAATGRRSALTLTALDIRTCPGISNDMRKISTKNTTALMIASLISRIRLFPFKHLYQYGIGDHAPDHQYEYFLLNAAQMHAFERYFSHGIVHGSQRQVIDDGL